ncbi:hypothetical protein LC55x_4692 [Lysobacter capsici]|nr:hypothetical protein LC55x_4692 [Lysobacter capsici]
MEDAEVWRIEKRRKLLERGRPSSIPLSRQHARFDAYL